MQGRFSTERMPRLLRLFLPDIDTEQQQTGHPASHVAHYTDVKGALGILESQELWFRCAGKMGSSTVAKDDEYEIKFGIDSFMSNWNGQPGNAIRNEVENIDPSGVREVTMEIEKNRSNVELETYIFCTCIHENKENSALAEFWKRSDVALVFNRSRLQVVAGRFGALTGLVQYRNRGEHSNYFEEWVRVLKNYGEELRKDEHGNLGKTLGWAVMYMAMLTKRPEYAEEREWRVFYRSADKGASPRFQMQQRETRVKDADETIYSMKVDITGNLLEKVLVMPGNNSHQTISLVKMMLRRSGISGVEVVLADIGVLDALTRVDFSTVQKFAALVALKLFARLGSLTKYVARLWS